MPFTQTVTLTAHPLFLAADALLELELFFSALGFRSVRRTVAATSDELADPSALCVAVVELHANPLEGSRFTYTRRFTFIIHDLSSAKRHIKAARDGFVGGVMQLILAGLLDDQDAFAEGTFTPPNGLTLPAYVRAVQDGMLLTFPSIPL